MTSRQSTILMLLLIAPVASAQWTADTGLILEGTIVTMTAEDAVIEDGRVLVQGESIVAIAGPGEPWPDGVDPTGALVVEVGYVFPGLINAHNHTAYNTLPLWEAPQLYENRYQWTNPSAYSTYVNYPKKLLTDSNYFNMTVEVSKYAEVKGLVGGETAIQGTPSRNGVNNMLIRNIEEKNFDEDRIYQRGLTIDDTRWQATIPSFLEKADAGNVDAWIVHLAEGIDEDPSHEEFDTLKTLDMLHEWTVIIHGTALQEVDFADMADIGAKLVWSPTSNMLLYGGTTRVDQALAAGIPVALATDWSPSGPKNLLDELKIAWELNKFFATDLPGWTPFDEYTLAKMVTSNAADALGWTEKVGRIEPGLAADLLVIDEPDDPLLTPYQALIRATVRDVALVVVAGEPLYGDVAPMKAAKSTDLEVLCSTAGFVKAIDVTRDGPYLGEQTWAAISTAIRDAMQFDPAHMRQVFKQPVAEGWTQEEFDQWFAAKFDDGVISMEPDPVYVTDDPVFFQRLQGSANASFPFDLQALYYGFLGDGPTAAVNLGIDDAELLDFVNNATEAVLTDDVGLAAEDAAAIVLSAPYATREALAEVAGGCPLVVLVSHVFGQKEPPPPPPPPDGEPVEGEAALLAFLNDPGTTLEVLDIDAALNKNAAAALIAYRNGPDGVYGTDDDNPFHSEAEVDGVSYIGPATLADLIAYAEQWSGQGGGQPGEGSKLTQFLNHPTTTLELLDDDVGLNANAALNLIDHRNGPDGIFGTADDDLYDSVEEVDDVSYVGPAALEILQAWAASWEAPSQDQQILDFVNDPLATLVVLDDHVGLNALAATNIVAHRHGPDGLAGTADDDAFDSLEELDSVPYVGPSALEQIATFAVTWALQPKGPPPVAVFLNHESTTFQLLNETVGLISTAAENLIAHRNGPDGELGTADDNPFESEEEVDEVKYVGSVTLGQLVDYAEGWSAP